MSVICRGRSGWLFPLPSPTFLLNYFAAAIISSLALFISSTSLLIWSRPSLSYFLAKSSSFLSSLSFFWTAWWRILWFCSIISFCLWRVRFPWADSSCCVCPELQQKYEHFFYLMLQAFVFQTSGRLGFPWLCFYYRAFCFVVFFWSLC